MLYTFIKADNTAGVLKIPFILTVKIITRNNNQWHREKSFLRSQQILSYYFSSLPLPEHVGSILFSPQPDSHPLI